MPVVTRIHRNGESRLITGFPDDPRALLSDPGTRVWLDVDSIDVPLLEEMGRRFDLHPLAIEDCHHSVQRPKVDEYANCFFFSFHAVDETAAGEVTLREIDGFLGPNFLITVHEEPSPELAELRARCERHADIMERGVDHLFYLLLDRMVDNHFPILDRIEQRIDAAEESIFSRQGNRVLQEIFNVRKELLDLRRIVGPQREILNNLASRENPFLAAQTRFYLRDIHDHLVRLVELVETYRDLSNGAMEAYRSDVQQRLNEVMKILTIIGTLSLPLTLVAGLWGMNFDRVPWGHDPNGFWFIVILLAAMVAVMLSIFKWAKWL